MTGRDFPDGFLWGASAAAHQVEGQNVNNDWWAWEHAPRSTAIEHSGDAIDFLHRYLWTGLAMLVFAGGMLFWSFKRPLSRQLADEERGMTGATDAPELPGARRATA